VERYAITYIQNFLNNCFLKIRQSNGFNTDKLLNNASRLHEMKPTANATLFLKFQVIGSINALDKRFEETAQELLKASENEFKNRVYYELGDRFRETGINEAKTKTIQYYSKIDDANKEYYQGWYKLGLLYEEADMISLAIEQYEKIIKTIQNFEACYRTPQEFEFLFKSKYKLLKWKIKGFLNAYYASGESTVLKAQAKDLANDCMKIYPNYFLTKMYGENNETAGKIKELMIEKMTIVELWIKKMGN
jgi:tetratricopeptide (TPR) repeat protein